MDKKELKKLVDAEVWSINYYHEGIKKAEFTKDMYDKAFSGLFRFQTLEEAETYYEEHINSNSNNMNEAFENARDSWTSDNSDDIKECWLENNK